MLIYKITNLINNKIYIGQTTRSLEERWRLHKRSKSCRAIYSAILKYGINNFKIETVCECLTIEELNIKESEYIQLYKSISPNGYNLRGGGNNNFLSEETKLKISNANKGQISWCAGKKLGPKSELIKQKISQAKLGKCPNVSKEGKIKQLNALLSYTKSKRKSVISECKTTGIITIYQSIVDATKEGFSQSEISKCCKFEFKKYSHKNKYWKFYNDNI